MKKTIKDKYLLESGDLPIQEDYADGKMPYHANDQDSSGKNFEEKKEVEEEITHDLKCGNCGDPAGVNYQLVWVSWDISKEGKYSNQEFHNTDTNEFWCDRCWELDRNEIFFKLKEIRKEA